MKNTIIIETDMIFKCSDCGGPVYCYEIDVRIQKPIFRSHIERFVDKPIIYCKKCMMKAKETLTNPSE